MQGFYGRQNRSIRTEITNQIRAFSIVVSANPEEALCMCESFISTHCEIFKLHEVVSTRMLKGRLYQTSVDK